MPMPRAARHLLAEPHAAARFPLQADRLTTAVSESFSPGELRPSGMTPIVARSFGLLFRHFLSSFGLGVVCSILPIGLFALALEHDSWKLMLVAGLGLYVAAFYWYAATMLTVSYDLIGAHVAWRQIFRRLRGMLAVRLFVASIAILALWSLSFVPLVFAVDYVSKPSWGGGLLILRGLGVLIVLVAVLPSLYVWTSCIFALPVVVLEAVSPWRAIRRSWQLVRGRRWEIAATVTIATALYLGGVRLLHTVQHSVGTDPGIDDLVVGSITYLAFVAWFIILSVLLYYDVRVRKEFLNVHWLQHQIT